MKLEIFSGKITSHRGCFFALATLVFIFIAKPHQTFAGASFVESYVIISGGSGAGDYYYEVIDNGGGNTPLVSIGNYNLLSGTNLVLKGGQNKVTVTPNDYQKSWNTQSINYRFYLDGSTAPSYTSMGNFTWGGDAYPTYTWTKSDLSPTLASSSTASGTYNLQVYSYGQATYWSGSADTGWWMTDSSTTTATINLFYGATAGGTQSSAFTGSGYFNFNGSGQTYTLNAANTYTGETQIDAGTVSITSTGSLSSSSMVYLGNGGNSSNAGLTLAGTTTFANNLQANVSAGAGTRTITKSDATSQTMSGAITLNQSTSFDIASGGSLALSGVVGGTNAFTKTGAGTMTLSGSSANTFSSGTVTVSAGTLVLNKSANTAAIAGRPVTVSSGATLRTDAAVPRASHAGPDGRSGVVLPGGTWVLADSGARARLLIGRAD